LALEPATALWYHREEYGRDLIGILAAARATESSDSARPSAAVCAAGGGRDRRYENTTKHLRPAPIGPIKAE
jgi:hypothetical protein